MVPLTALWLPILVSAVLAFIAANILHMVLAFWHRGDYGKAPNSATLIDAIKTLPAGQYVVPSMDWGKATEAEKAAAMAGPSAVVIVRNPWMSSMAKPLVQYFVYCVVISLFVGYLTGRTVAPGTDYLQVFRIAGTAGVMAWALGGHASDSIWFGRPWVITFKHIIDGVIYGLLIGGTFGWLWPK